MLLQQVESHGTSSQPRFAASATSDELIADNTGEIPFSVLAEFKVIGMVARHLCGHAYGAPSPIDIGSASHGFSRVSPRSIRFVFINEFEPSLGGSSHLHRRRNRTASFGATEHDPFYWWQM